MFRLAHGVPHNHLGHRLHLRHYNKRPPTERTVFHLPPTCYGICLQNDSSAPSSVTATTHSAPRTRSGYVQSLHNICALSGRRPDGLLRTGRRAWLKQSRPLAQKAFALD